MKRIITIVLGFVLVISSNAQHIANRSTFLMGSESFLVAMQARAMVSSVDRNAPREVTLFENANFEGKSFILKPGTYTLSSFSDIASSLKVSPGIVAVVYENVTNSAGYGMYADFLEDCADLSVYGLDNKLSYINIFYAKKGIYNYARGRIVNGEFVAGHWERDRVNGAKPDNNPPAAVNVLPAPGLKIERKQF